MHKHRESDLGFSYYNVFNNYLSFEVLSGVGYGSMFYSSEQDLAENYKFSFNSKKINYFTQPSFSCRIQDYLDFTLFTRINYNRYFQITREVSLGNKSEVDRKDRYLSESSNSSLFFLEPGLQIQGGSDVLKVKAIFAKSIDIMNTGVGVPDFKILLGISIRPRLVRKND